MKSDTQDQALGIFLTALSTAVIFVGVNALITLNTVGGL